MILWIKDVNKSFVVTNAKQMNLHYSFAIIGVEDVKSSYDKAGYTMCNEIILRVIYFISRISLVIVYLINCDNGPDFMDIDHYKTNHGLHEELFVEHKQQFSLDKLLKCYIKFVTTCSLGYKHALLHGTDDMLITILEI